jgi:hypothetical protein
MKLLCWFVAALLLGGCAVSATDARVAGGAGAPVRADLVPASLAGLTVTPEDISKEEKQAGARSYLTSSRLWAFRAGTKLRATLQVGRFTPDAFASPDPDHVVHFERQIVDQIGQASARLRVLGGRNVYVTSGNEQPLFVWFTGSTLFILSMAKDFGEPRGLLRAALELQP